MPGAMPDDNNDFNNTYGPVVPLHDSLRSALASQGKSLSDSLGPVYYPKHPQSERARCGTPNTKEMSPMTPLQAPWPHLPPLEKGDKKKKQKVPTSVRNFLEQQGRRR